MNETLALPVDDECDGVLRAADDDRPSQQPRGASISNDEWMRRLTTTGRVRDDAILSLRELMLKAAGHQVHRMHGADRIGAARVDEVVHSAANEATLVVLSRLDTFEGRSRFTTWAFKFGVLHAKVEMRRLVWRDREIQLDDSFDIPNPVDNAPEATAEVNDLHQAVRRGLAEALTQHQRRIATALLIDEVPIDVLAERLGTSRGALYKTVHESRKKLRLYLEARGLVDTDSRTENHTTPVWETR
ncbi:RNA polymerase sigma-70 factor (ECF subfamily) [Cryobacterium mesophilum]|uniref:RNA polymerase sigma factor n=1 Tax=Terrimesophilobacter mesophilus TaxID=433647 RepID=UPI00157F9F34|nr:sigma-70 family RNA polymerase sigma factor [Terrimesophilobacter mesophilus]MBB5632571.1 RNA polymerase sigma-70 factor (ECF subfamily) [Terrimesophilobacter mesophilus]